MAAGVRIWELGVNGGCGRTVDVHRRGRRGTRRTGGGAARDGSRETGVGSRETGVTPAAAARGMFTVPTDIGINFGRRGTRRTGDQVVHRLHRFHRLNEKQSLGWCVRSSGQKPPRPQSCGGYGRILPKVWPFGSVKSFLKIIIDEKFFIFLAFVITIVYYGLQPIGAPF